MLEFNPSKTWTSIQEKLDKTTDPRHRQMLGEVLAHAKAEVAGDLEGVMATLSASPVYRYVRDHGPVDQPRGTEAIRDFYVNEIFGGGRHILEIDHDRIVVDDDAVVTEGTLRILQWGRDLAERSASVDPDATYLLTVRMLIVWPFDENCKITGEESWTQPLTSQLERVADERVPNSFRDYITSKLEAAQAVAP
jgi:hypothetical protein